MDHAAVKAFHIAMCPLFAFGHLTSFLHISNKLAERGHKISFFLPKSSQPKLNHFNLHPDLIFIHPTCIKALHYCTISPATFGYLLSPERKLPSTEADLVDHPPSFPPSSIKLQLHEARRLASTAEEEFGKGVSFMERQLISITKCDAIVFKTCREMEGPYCDYLDSQLGKQILLAGPVLPEPPTSTLEEKWETWLVVSNPKQ
ncbi:hypothetical protein L6164_029700 [Bauhinia variegata]|uniref:Uncharacterized protein n=1 Tax=Bauhinia variegata TaxID=167791 RepID=A0ACB9LA46_BAUVA|nr:hypothetical protein L6164_029700 [Bauhinia variegata]